MQHSFLAGPTVDIEKGRPKNNGVRHQLSSISEWGWVVGRLVSMQNKLLLPLSKSIDVSYNLYDFDDFKNAFAEHAQSLKQRLWTAVILIFKNHIFDFQKYMCAIFLKIKSVSCVLRRDRGARLVSAEQDPTWQACIRVKNERSAQKFFCGARPRLTTYSIYSTCSTYSRFGIMYSVLCTGYLY